MKYVALLRGINVGGNNRVEMSKLKGIFEDLGYLDVVTYINTGNVIFEIEEKNNEIVKKEIEKALKDNFKFEIRVVLRDGKNIEKVCKKIPTDWQNNDEMKTDVLFLWEEFDNKKSLDLINKKEGIDNLIYVDGAIVWNVDRKNYTKSGMNKFINSVLYKNMTARNVNTVRKICELMKNNER
jgi:uncharacterized protein (DUF1697 family)